MKGDGETIQFHEQQTKKTPNYALQSSETYNTVQPIIIC